MKLRSIGAALGLFASYGALSIAASEQPAASRSDKPVPVSTETAVLAQGDASFDSSVPAALEVVRAKTGHLLVRPTLNGRDAGYFIFDSGAGICVVSTPHVESFGLQPVGKIKSVGVGGRDNSAVYRAETLVLGPATFHKHPVMAADLSFLKQHLGEEIVGVIGFGVLSQVIAEVDLKAPRISLHNPAGYKLTSGEWAPLVLDDRIPAIRARFEDHDGLFKLDLGSNSALSLYAPAVQKWSLLDGRETSDAKTGGVGGYVSARQGAVRWIEFGGIRRETVHATFGTEAKGTGGASHRDGHIGVPLLEPFVLIFDYTQRRIAFVKRG